MQANVGGIDRILRIVAGLIILALFFVLQGDSKWFALVGIVPLLTGFIRFCPIYPLLGISTCDTSKK